MIDTSIHHIAEELNQFLKRKFDLDEDVVVVSNILEQDGTVAPQVNNKVVVSLVNIEKDTLPYQQMPKANFSNVGSQRSVVSSPPAFFNIYLMFSSYFGGSNYHEGLKFISSTISFFQGQPVFDRANSPGMAENIERLIMDIENLSMSDLSNLWSVLSGKYLPSILYRVRMVTFDSDTVSRQTDPASQFKPIVNSN